MLDAELRAWAISISRLRYETSREVVSVARDVDMGKRALLLELCAWMTPTEVCLGDWDRRGRTAQR